METGNYKTDKAGLHPPKKAKFIRTLLVDVAFVAVIIGALGYLYQRTPYRWLAYYANSDPCLALVVSQAILEHGSVRLDYYESDLPDTRLFSYEGHLYDYFPLGSSLIALPAVAWARHVGHDMRKMPSNWHVQFLLALATSIFIAAGMYVLARNQLSPLKSFLLSVSFFFGTPLIVTLLTAYWSHNAALICVIGALLLHRYFGEESFLKTRRCSVGIAIGFLSGFAYISRPTMALFCLLMLALALHQNWRNAIPVAFGIALTVGGLMVFSFMEYGELLPPYYGGGRLGGVKTFIVALAGNLMSPSRGILVHAPIVGVVLFASLWSLWRRTMPALGLGCLVWYVVHLASISLFPHWWAGWSYGARFQVDVMPAIFLLAVFLWPHECAWSRLKRALVLGVLLILIIWGVWIHTVQGLLNPTTAKWSKVPDIDQYPHLIWNWKYPQFLASQEQLDKRLEYLAEIYPELGDKNSADY